MREPSSSIAARQTFSTVSKHKKKKVVLRGAGLRTHQSLLERSNRPAVQKIFHHQNISDDTLVVPEQQAADGSEYRRSEGERVVQEPGEPSWTVSVHIAMLVD